jgi:glutamyl-tRNA synthetase
MTVRTRFAPSPTGYMHIGNLRTALYAYLLARRYDGVFILRIEDTDQNRYVDGALDVIFNVLRLTGLKHDEGPDVGGPVGPYTQSERKPIYREYAEKLIDLGGAYYCFCSREALLEARESQDPEGTGAFKVHDPCRYLPKEEARARALAGEPHVVRQRIPERGTTTVEDGVFGRIVVENRTLDESVLLKSDGLPTYNFANVVDDHLMKITHVMRGVEYLASAPKYNLLYNTFGWDIPVYLHLPHIVKEGGKKLSKREGDASFEDFYSKGFLVPAIVNYIALLGWNPGTEQEFFTLPELEKAFSIEGLSKSSAMFDLKKMRWMNGEYIRRMPLEEFHALALPHYRSVITKPDLDLLKLSDVLHDRTEVVGEIPEQIDFFNAVPEYSTDLYVHKKMKTDLPMSLANLEAAYDVLKGVSPWTHEAISAALLGLVEKLGLKNGQVLWPVRTALSGKQMTPGGAIEIGEVLGKEETLTRIKAGIAKVRSAL